VYTGFDWPAVTWWELECSISVVKLTVAGSRVGRSCTAPILPGAAVFNIRGLHGHACPDTHPHPHPAAQQQASCYLIMAGVSDVHMQAHLSLTHCLSECVNL
jgi:hypothetical protein